MEKIKTAYNTLVAPSLWIMLLDLFTTRINVPLQHPKSKHAFERFCLNHGVTIQEYAADNNPFHSFDWTNNCHIKHQRCFLSGIGAHHQN
mmetsp:Transcript_15113/g.42025  ORF Transcript_15113/g.42025 Transcript_15113/m.42025 type:complete len:90 (-) Transcript_15113:804-1073(-)